MKKIRIKSICLFCVLISFITVIICIISVKQGGKEDYNHRLEWWLSYIDWDTDRLDYNGKGIKIAVLDTGVRSSHPDINHCIKKELEVPNVNKEEHQNFAHGTGVVGVISGKPSTKNGILGIATDAEIISINITNEDSVEVENLINGIQIAIDNNVDIINISVGVKIDSTELHQNIQRAYEKGIIIVASAGNYMNNDVLYPAKYKEVLCVGALSKKGQIISPKGKVSNSIIYLPGENIVTASTTSTGYVGANGTSFAAPILTGIIAVMKEANPLASNKDIYDYFNNLDNSNRFSVKDCIRYIKGV